jgi:hypothetical protein
MPKKATSMHDSSTSNLDYIYNKNYFKEKIMENIINR